MNVFFHGTIEAGFDVLKAKIEKVKISVRERTTQGVF